MGINEYIFLKPLKKKQRREPAHMATAQSKELHDPLMSQDPSIEKHYY